MTAPTAELIRFALLRPARREVAASATSKILLLTPSSEVVQAMGGSDKDRQDLRKKLILQISGHMDQLSTADALLKRLSAADSSTFADDEDLKALKDAFAVKAELTPALLALQDLYFLLIAADDHLNASEAGARYRAAHALKTLPSVKSSSEALELANTVIVANLERKASPSVEENQQDVELLLRHGLEGVYLKVLIVTIDQLISSSQFKTMAEAPKQVQPPTGGDPKDFAQVNRGGGPSKVVSSVDLTRLLGDRILKFLKDDFFIDDANKADIVELRVSAELRLNQKLEMLLAGRPLRGFKSFQDQFQQIVAGYRAGRIKDLEGAVKSFAVGTLRPHAAPKLEIGPKGVIDLKVVRQQLQRYELGEIAHIENVLAGETRVREHYRGEKIEQMFSFEEEQISTAEKDLQTSERFDLSQETQRVVDEKRKTEAGLNVSATYGVVTIAADARMSDEQSIQESAKVARNYARETISKASERLEKRTKKQTTMTTTLETKEDNKHSFSASADSISGVYRWVAKHYWCQTYNYGARMMFELEIPEPAAFYLYALANGTDAGTGLQPPEAITFTANDLDDSTYQGYAAAYGADVSAPPAAFAYANIGTLQGQEKKDGASETHEIEIPDDYEMLSISPIGAARVIANGLSAFEVLVSPFMWTSAEEFWSRRWFPVPVRGKFEIGFNGVYVEHYAISANLFLQRTKEAYAKWQLATFNAIQDAYNARRSEYERKLASLQARRQTITARTDQECRDIERTELKRLSIQLITGNDFSQNDAMQFPKKGPPYIDTNEALIEGKFVRFAEENFEWSEMVYTFYPYFWGGTARWADTYAEGNQDPVFQRFLRAGFSKVLISVRPGAERYVLYYLETGTFWSGDDPPLPNDPAYISMVLELEGLNAEDRVQGVAEGAPWRQIVPTNLVCLETEKLKLPSWELDVPVGESGYEPSEELCNGRPYNAAQWPNDRKAVISALRTLGFNIPKNADPIPYLRSKNGIRTVRAFQTLANDAGVGQALGAQLRVDGIMGACTLRGLTVAVAMNSAGSWPKPV